MNDIKNEEVTPACNHSKVVTKVSEDTQLELQQEREMIDIFSKTKHKSLSKKLSDVMKKNETQYFNEMKIEEKDETFRNILVDNGNEKSLLAYW